MHTRFTSITNELHCLGQMIPLYKPVRKILGVLTKSWESKVEAINEARNLKTLTMDELNENLKTDELKKLQRPEKKEAKREKFLALKAFKYDLVDDEDTDVTYLVNRIVKAMKMSG